MDYIAHICYDGEKRREQSLYDHCVRTARYTSWALTDIGLVNCGHLTGLLHDVGKGSSEFQNYIRYSSAYDAYNSGLIDKPDFPCPVRGSVIHTFQGCIYLLERFHRDCDQMSQVTAEILATAIASHHGLFDCKGLDESNGFLHRLRYDKSKLDYEECIETLETEICSKSEIDNLFNKAKTEIGNTMKLIGNKFSTDGKCLQFQISMLERLITSALMYGDRRDTEEFMTGSYIPDIEPDWDIDIRNFEEKYSGFASDSLINKIRSDMSAKCRDFAEKEDGIYQLDIPTGGGKTLSSLRYALYHARKFKKKKIIYVIPLLSIMDQNAALIREYLPGETVLEHHSDVVTDNMTQDELSKYDIQKDRWTAPVIITTLVRILDILFGAKTADITRMRALCDSIIIFDEVQSVPANMTSLFTGALNFLNTICHVDVILSSATPPSFDHSNWPLFISGDRPVELSEEDRKAFDRHTYHLYNDKKPVQIDNVSSFAKEAAVKYGSVMIVCNTKNEARTIYQQIKEHIDGDVTVKHLSAGMCKAHRQDVISYSIEQLAEIQKGYADKPFILVTTQIVEAGVDISFRCVIRLMAGIENAVQAAGRCNRGNEYGSGDVYIINLDGEEKALKHLPDIKDEKKAMSDSISYEDINDYNPESDKAIRDYYIRLYRLQSIEYQFYPFEENGMNYTIGGVLGNNQRRPDEDRFFMCQPFKTAAEKFSVFDSNSYTVVVPYGDSLELINEIDVTYRKIGLVPKSLLDKIKKYCVQIFQWQMDKLRENGQIYTACEDSILIATGQAYNDEYGIDTESEYNVTDFIL